jgi:hypothetical protein
MLKIAIIGITTKFIYNKPQGRGILHLKLIMQLTTLELITIKSLIDQKIELYESWLNDEQLSDYFANRITELQTLKTKIDEERIGKILC